MEIVIELPGGRTDLSEPNEFTSFSVRVIGEASVGELARVVAASGLGRTAPGGDHVVVEPGALRRLAAEAVDATWEANFEKMCAYAQSMGWIEEDGGIVAHVQWGGPTV